MLGTIYICEKTMHRLSTLLFATIFTIVTADLHAQTIESSSWCKTVKTVIDKIQKDPRSIAGKQIDSTEYSVEFVSKLNITGADSVRVFFYPDGGRIDRVVAYYGDKATKKQYDKTYNSLAQNLKACFKTTEVMEYPHEMGYGKAVNHTMEEEYIGITVATQSKAVIDRFPGVMVVIRSF